MKKLAWYFALLIATTLITSCSGGGDGESAATVTGNGTATLNWAAPTSDVDGAATTIAGYKIYYGTESGTYTSVIDVGKRNSYTVSGLPEGATYFFAVTAYNASGVESDPTDEQATTL